jgi:hypothetical protein
MRGFIDGEYQDGELRGLAFLAGKRGMGKTTEMVRLISACTGGVVFFDSLSKHQGVLPSSYQMVSQPGEMKTYLAANYGKAFRILYQPRKGSLDEHFIACAEIVKAVGWMIFAIDEVDKLCGPRWGDSRMPPALYDLVNYGRHHRVSMLATARRPHQVARGYTSECREMRLFRITERADLKYFADYIGEEEAAKLPTLQPYQFIRWDDSGEDSEVCGGRR